MVDVKTILEIADADSLAPGLRDSLLDKQFLEVARDLRVNDKLTKFQYELITGSQFDSEDESGKYEIPIAFDKYYVIEHIGEGAMGHVYKVQHRMTKNIHALKVMKSNCDPAYLSRFQREVSICSKLDSPNIVRTLDAGTIEDRPYLVMEYIDGESLYDKLANDGPVKWEEAFYYASEVARALSEVHSSGIVHRDVKPHNILISRKRHVKLADFGIAKNVARETFFDEGLTSTGQIVGTAAYVSPDQVEDSHGVGREGDMYSLGCTLFELITGEIPFPGSSRVEVIEKKKSLPFPQLTRIFHSFPALVG